MELHALAQGELDGAFVDTLPALRQARHLLELAQQVLGDQPLIDEGEDALADVGLFAQRLQRGRVGDLLHGNGDAGAAVGLADGDARQAEACRGKPGGGDQMAATQEHGANSSNEAATLCRLDERSVSVL